MDKKGFFFPEHNLRKPEIDSPPPPQFPSENSFPVLTLSILGILTTSILLLSYYIFVIKCCWNWHNSDAITSWLSRSSRRRNLPFMTYSTAHGNHGLKESTIRAIPTVRYRRNNEERADQRSFHECAVCLNEFQEEERIRLLPNCLHVFHIDCIDTWLQTNANCPLCRTNITTAIRIPIPATTNRAMPVDQDHQSSCPNDVVIEIRDDHVSEQSESATSSSGGTNGNAELSSKKTEHKFGQNKERKHQQVCSMGDECINVRGKDEQFCVETIRRSFSMDSSTDKHFYVAVQKILQQNQHFQGFAGDESSSSSSSVSKLRRSIFSFGRSSRSAVNPVKIQL